MLLTFVFCIAVTKGGICLAVTRVEMDVPVWSDRPCPEMVPPHLAPRLLYCRKLPKGEAA